ncbi:MAG: coproporphyrinogen III oxidase, partial [Balneolaceae bacterium]
MKSDLNLDLVQKYNVPGPRYTSYPTALQFEDLDNSADLKKYLTNQQAAPKKISLYFHIPFCCSLCWYCGCTKVISRNTGTGDVYLEYLN